MSTTERSLERRLADGLVAEAPLRGPDRLADSVLARTAQRRPRPRWLTLIRESPKQLDQRPSFGSPLARTTGILVVTLLVALPALGTVVAGASLLPRPSPSTLIPPERGVFISAGASIDQRSEGLSASRLADGRVLVVGGYGMGEASAELWDLNTGPFSPAGSLHAGSPGSSPFGTNRATLLADGRVLVLPTGEIRPEMWDSKTRAFRRASSLPADALPASPRCCPTAESS